MDYSQITAYQLASNDWLQFIYIMSNLDESVRRIYGERLKKKNSQGYSHHLYTLYQDTNTNDSYFLRNIELPAHYHISESTASLMVQKYKGVMSELKILPLNRNFQTYSYLIRAPYNVILLNSFLEIKRQCLQVIQVDFFLRFLQFIVRTFNIVSLNKLPLFSLSQIGITDSGQFILCDPSLYFKNNDAIKNDQSFSQWIVVLLNQFLGPPNGEDPLQMLKKVMGQQCVNVVKPLIQYLVSGVATPELMETKVSSFMSRLQDQTTTVNSSFADINDIHERSLKQISFKKEVKSHKISKIGRTVVVFVILGSLITAGYFSFKFFNRNIVCSEGQFESDNLCKACSNGCLRCQNGEPNKCMKCSSQMYLVLDEQDDSEGLCLKECRGKLINMQVCIRQKQLSMEQSNNDNHLTRLSRQQILTY